jgi:hypothetical protein
MPNSGAKRLMCARSVTAFLATPRSQRPGQGPRSRNPKAGRGRAERRKVPRPFLGQARMIVMITTADLKLITAH